MQLGQFIKSKNSCNASRHTVDKWTLDNVSFLWVSSTIAANISVLNGAFLVVGLARGLHKPLTMTVTNGTQVGNGGPAYAMNPCYGMDYFFNCWFRPYRTSYILEVQDQIFIFNWKCLHTMCHWPLLSCTERSEVLFWCSICPAV